MYAKFEINSLRTIELELYNSEILADVNYAKDGVI